MGLEPNPNRTRTLIFWKNRTRTLRFQIRKEPEQNRTQQWRFFDFFKIAANLEKLVFLKYNMQEWTEVIWPERLRQIARGALHFAMSLLL